MTLRVRILRAGDRELLRNVAPGLFDGSIDDLLADEFLNDPRHHLAVAIEGDVVIGFASGVHYVHPDKPAELWINEVAVAEPHRGRGIGKQVVETLLEEGRRLGCVEAWVLTDRSNTPAMRLYASCGGEASDQVMFSFKLT
jgi:GNAT superfamily N-acetyltransferase